MKNMVRKWLLLCSVFVLVLSSPSLVWAKENSGAQKGGASWDKSSLSFISEGGNCDEIWAEVRNGSGSKAMQGVSRYEVYGSASGNPKFGEIVAEGEIPPLQSGDSFQLEFDPNGVVGNYMFKAYQREGHPGKGELWSEAITVSGPCDPSDKPGNPDTPGNGDKQPGNPDTPGNEEKPSNPDTPGNEEKPSNPDAPGNEKKPGNPDTSGNVDQPGSGDHSNGSQENQEKMNSDEKEGFSLPDTATKYPLMILIGIAVAVVGGLLFFFSRKKVSVK